MFLWFLLRRRANELWENIYDLESEKFDLTEKMKRQKYEVRHVADRNQQTDMSISLFTYLIVD